MLLDVVFRLVTFSTISAAGIISAGLIIKKKPTLTIENIIVSIVAMLFCSFFYTTNPQISMTIMFIPLMIITLNKIYKLKIITSITLALLTTVLIVITDSLLTIILFLVYPDILDVIRETWYIIITTNIVIAFLTIILSYLLPKLNKTQNIITYLETQTITDEIYIYLTGIIYFIALFTLLIVETNDNFNILIVCSLVLIYIMFVIFVKDKLRLNEINDKYNRIYTYVKTFENWIEEEQLVRHEYKNTLSKLLEITKEPEVTKEINKLLKANVSIGKDVIELMSAIPKGGLKGILYYKISMAKENKVKMYVNVSETVKNKFKKFSKADYKTLCFLIGIFCDNAIEAASKSKKKQISVEIYYQQDKFHFVISNSTDVKVDLNKIENKGESTKGKGRGSGLYFAKKLLSSNSQFIKNTKQQKEYFTQELIY